MDNCDTWVFNAEDGKMEKRNLQYIPGLYKIFDEILVNAVDHCTRLKTIQEDNVNPVKNIKIAIDKMTGWIEVSNDGDGIEVEKHPEHHIYIPELIFGHLLTSANYDDKEERTIGGQNGLGSKACNIFSKEFYLETVDARRKKLYKQTWKDNMSEKTTPEIKSCSKKPYTIIKFLPDYAKFKQDGMSQDMYDMMVKRAYDTCAVTTSEVNVFLNGAKLEYKTFEKYVDLYLGSKSEHPRVYEHIDDRWEVVASFNDDGGFQQVSFVNGIWTIRGGKHVEYMSNQLVKKLIEYAQKKKKDIAIKPQYLKDNLIIFIKSVIVNPNFDSQTKETLTTPYTKFGSKPELSEAFIQKMYKSGIIEKAVSIGTALDTKSLKKTDGKKRSTISGIPSLDDANWAGTSKSRECTLILTEGLSAKTMAIAGISVVGRDKWGVFPLRGKVMNVKDATTKKIYENQEISNLKKILGLESGKEYTNLEDLRYGRVMCMVDADDDGSHIKGLIFNLFHTLWPSLMCTKGFEFMCSLLTPIVKVSKGKDKHSFYCLNDVEQWKQANNNGVGWTIKYFKGLGTSTEEEAVEYFTNMRDVCYRWTSNEDGSNPSNECLDLAFNKARADDRKKWLSNYDKTLVLDYKDKDVSYEDFIHKELIHFSNYDLERSIPNMCDGLKVSQRKIMYCCFKRQLWDKEIRLAQLASYVSEHSVYHHGEASLQMALTAMAQDFVGSNNINLLKPIGQFGCLDPDTDIIMWDATIKKAKDIKIGDQLIGDDGTVRNVLKTTSGVDDMYEVKMIDGHSYKVNSQHLLTLKYKTTKNCHINVAKLTKAEAYEHTKKQVGGLEFDDIFDIKMEDYLKLSKSARERFYCVKNSTPVEWKSQSVPIDPYVFGCWLGDGSSNAPGITSMDKDTLKEFALIMDTISNNKHVPMEYIINSKEARRNLLAGVIDTADGCIKYNGGTPIIEICQSERLHKHLIESIELVCNSLGYRTSVTTVKREDPAKKGESKDMLSLLVYGVNLDLIPTKVPRKHIAYESEHDGYVLEFTVTHLGKGEFCGWSVDGNERFLLGDFTVTHNSRIHAGKDAASPRYIYTVISPITRTLFMNDDSNTLTYLADDGYPVEPEHYIPIIPMLLVNGAVGIGTGFSTNIPCYNPKDIVRVLKKLLDGEDVDHLNQDHDLVPWYKGFTGKIEKYNGKWTSKGGFVRTHATKIEINELPVGVWTADFKEMLEDMMCDKEGKYKNIPIRSYESQYSAQKVKFILNFASSDALDAWLVLDGDHLKIEHALKLVSTKVLGTTNMYAFNELGQITKYETAKHIIMDFYKVRLAYYTKRKDLILDTLRKEMTKLNNKIKFVKDVIAGTIPVYKLKKADLEARLHEDEYDLHDETYDYLTKIPIYNFTTDKVAELEDDIRKKEAIVIATEGMTEKEMWRRDLEAFEREYEKFLATTTKDATVPKKSAAKSKKKST